MPLNLFGGCDNRTTTVEARRGCPLCAVGLRDQVPAWGADRQAPGHPWRGVRQRGCRLGRRAGRAGRGGRSRPAARRLPAAGRGRRAGELPQGRLGAAAAPTLPGAQPPGAPVVAVVLRVLSWW